jgi:gliding motility-associated peptidyl-prolyl isomerase
MMDKLIVLVLLLTACLACKTPEARKPISVKTGSFIDASVARNKKLNAKEHALIEQIMTKDTTYQYVASKTGFWYCYNTKTADSSATTPLFGDVVNYSYHLKDLNGRLIYPLNNFKNLDYPIDKEELFTGLREGLKLMRTGETVTFLFPSQKAYGYYGDENKIGSNVPLICEVTLNSITKTEAQ